MPVPILLVEGDDDKTFLATLTSNYLNVSSDKLDILSAGGLDKLHEALKVQVRLQLARIGIAQDLNAHAPAQVVAQIRDVLGVAHVSEKGNVLRVGTSRVVVIPMGLYQDAELSSLGVTRHAMEDYLLKAFLEDKKLWQWAGVSDAKQFLRDVLEVYSRHGVRPTSSKDIWHFIKGLPAVPFDSRGAIKRVLAHCDKDILGKISAAPVERLRLLVEETP